jgi:hypothetical protein
MARIRSIKPEFWKKEQEAWGFARENLYLVREGEDGALKIGIAGHPVRRLASLQCGNHRKLNLVAVYSGSAAACMAVERYVLRHFGPTSGEWFWADIDDVLKFIGVFAEDAE